jgi:nucleoside-diphosphate-sugar epimerase
MAMKSLVIGGSGYVGLEICRQLLQRGDVVVVVNRSGGQEYLPVETIAADIADGTELHRGLTGRCFDTIYHVASLPGDSGDPVEMMRVNIMGLANVLEYSRRVGTGRLILSSSISAYEWFPATKFNAPNYLPVDEEHPCRPKDMYSSSKRMQEILALTFYHQYRVPIAVLRLTAVVGPNGRGGGRGWREFARQLMEGQRVQIPHLSLDEVCHYVDLRDVARMHLLAAEHPDAIGQIFNCCGPAPTSGHEFATIVRRHFPGIRVEMGFPWSMAQGNRIEFDMTKARRLLGFAPCYSMEDSIVAIKRWIENGAPDEDGRRPQS